MNAKKALELTNKWKLHLEEDKRRREAEVEAQKKAASQLAFNKRYAEIQEHIRAAAVEAKQVTRPNVHRDDDTGRIISTLIAEGFNVRQGLNYWEEEVSYEIEKRSCGCYVIEW